MPEYKEQIREWARAEYENDPVLRSIATTSNIDVIINMIKSHPERDIHLPMPRIGYMLDAMNVYRRILKNGGKYRGFQFDLYELFDWTAPLTWDEAQRLMEDDNYKSYSDFRLYMHDDTGRVNVGWLIPVAMLAETSQSYSPSILI